METIVEKKKSHRRRKPKVTYTTGDIALNINHFNKCMGTDFNNPSTEEAKNAIENIQGADSPTIGTGEVDCGSCGDGLGESLQLSEATKRYIKRYYIRPQNIFCSNKTDILKALADMDGDNCSVYTLKNLDDHDDVHLLKPSDIIYYYDNKVLYDKNHVQVLDYDLFVKHEEERKKFVGDIEKVSDAEFNKEYKDRMTDETKLDDIKEACEIKLDEASRQKLYGDSSLDEFLAYSTYASNVNPLDYFREASGNVDQEAVKAFLKPILENRKESLFGEKISFETKVSRQGWQKHDQGRSYSYKLANGKTANGIIGIEYICEIKDNGDIMGYSYTADRATLERDPANPWNRRPGANTIYQRTKYCICNLFDFFYPSKPLQRPCVHKDSTKLQSLLNDVQKALNQHISAMQTESAKIGRIFARRSRKAAAVDSYVREFNASENAAVNKLWLAEHIVKIKFSLPYVSETFENALSLIQDLAQNATKKDGTKEPYRIRDELDDANIYYNKNVENLFTIFEKWNNASDEFLAQCKPLLIKDRDYNFVEPYGKTADGNGGIEASVFSYSRRWLTCKVTFDENPMASNVPEEIRKFIRDTRSIGEEEKKTLFNADQPESATNQPSNDISGLYLGYALGKLFSTDGASYNFSFYKIGSPYSYKAIQAKSNPVAVSESYESIVDENPFVLDFEDIDAYGNKLTENKDEDSDICCICGEKIEGYGNNADPYRDGRCCDACNVKFVIPARIRMLHNSRKDIK